MFRVNRSLRLAMSLAAACSLQSMLGCPAVALQDDTLQQFEQALQSARELGQPVFVYVFDGT